MFVDYINLRKGNKGLSWFKLRLFILRTKLLTLFNIKRWLYFRWINLLFFFDNLIKNVIIATGYTFFPLHRINLCDQALLLELWKFYKICNFFIHVRRMLRILWLIMTHKILRLVYFNLLHRQLRFNKKRTCLALHFYVVPSVCSSLLLNLQIRNILLWRLLKRWMAYNWLILHAIETN
jgi:hypothetical protein